MGYDTYFSGEFEIGPKSLKPEHIAELKAFNETRHDDHPGTWCKWISSDDGTQLVWDGREKFYDYAEWLTHLIDHYFKPWGYTLNGAVYWDGEDSDDHGIMRLEDNELSGGQASIVYPD